jgi:zinc protease
MRLLTFESLDTPLAGFSIAAPRGALSDPIGQEGLHTHCTELARRGAGERDRVELDALVDSLGASLSVVIHRDYFYVSGYCLQRHVETMFDLAMQVLRQPRFDREEHEKLVREMLYDLDELRDDDHTLTHRFFQHCAFPGHPYARTTLGTEESLGRITLEAARTAYQKLVQTPGFLVTFAGAVAAPRAESIVGRYDWPQPDQPLDQNLEVPAAPAGRSLVIVDKPERNQCSLLIGQSAPLSTDPDFDALRVAETAFGATFTSRLNQEIRVKHGWSYDADCTLYEGRFPAWLQISMSPTAEACGRALARTLEMIEELATRGISEEEFAFARSFLRGSDAFARATARQRMQRALRDAMMGRPDGHTDRFPERLAGLTADKVNEVAARRITPGQLTAIVVASADRTADSLPRSAFDRFETRDYRSV